MGCPLWPPMGLQDCCIVCCSIADVNGARGLDLRQTGRQSLSSQQPTSLSATLAVTKSIMFNMLCHFWHHGGLWIFLSLLSALIFFLPSFTAPFELSSVFSPGNMPSKEGRFTYLKPSYKTLLHFGWVGNVLFEGRWETVIVMPLPVFTRTQSIPQCCFYQWTSCYGCSWHILHDSSRSLLFLVVSCK